jgi:hypothetical protein
MEMDSFTIRRLQPGRVLDGHVHDILGFPEPVWPYSTHPNAQGRLRDWLMAHAVTIWLPGQGHCSDDCVILVRGFRDSFSAVSESHALSIAVLSAHYLLRNGRHIPISGRY